MSLEELRRRIDQADAKIVKLIAERITIAEEIGGEKSQLGIQTEDIIREKQVLEHVKSIAQEEGIGADAHPEAPQHPVDDRQRRRLGADPPGAAAAGRQRRISVRGSRHAPVQRRTER